VLFSISAVSLEKKLLWFVQNVPDNFDKVCNFFSYNFNSMGQILQPFSTCIVSQENNNSFEG
jgi:hypothetical protein